MPSETLTLNSFILLPLFLLKKWSKKCFCKAKQRCNPLKRHQFNCKKIRVSNSKIYKKNKTTTVTFVR